GGNGHGGGVDLPTRLERREVVDGGINAVDLYLGADREGAVCCILDDLCWAGCPGRKPIVPPGRRGRGNNGDSWGSLTFAACSVVRTETACRSGLSAPERTGANGRPESTS